MKNKKTIISIIVIFLLIIIGIISLNQYKLQQNSGSIFKASKEHKNYKIVCLSGNIDNLTLEKYFIIDSNRKVVEERRITAGYTDEELKYLYNQINVNDDLFSFNAEIKGKSIVYSSIVLRDQNIDKIIEGFKLTYTNVTVKEI
ncbi:MAG: hypothetical protein N2749_04740 [Clostridia bacterium]|nr:hypothetical protein [Clostridia bacterium]